MPESPVALYRFRNDARELLYIGITRRPEARWDEHAAEKPWWGEVQDMTIEWHPDRLSAATAEAKAIIDERPRYNLRREMPGVGYVPDRHIIATLPVELLAEIDARVAKVGAKSRNAWLIAALEWAVEQTPRTVTKTERV